MKKQSQADVDGFYDVEMALLADCVKAFARNRTTRRMSFGKVTTDVHYHSQEQRVRVLRYLKERFVGKDVAL